MIAPPKSLVPRSAGKEAATPIDEVLILPQGDYLEGTFERIQVEAMVKVEQTTPPAKDERIVKVEVCVYRTDWFRGRRE